MRLATSLLLALTVAVPARAEWTPPTAPENLLLFTSEVLIAVDCLQTHEWLKNPNFYEMNPLLGRRPSDLRLFAACGAVMLGAGLGGYFLPRPWRNVVTLSVIFVEAPNVVWNMGVRF